MVVHVTDTVTISAPAAHVRDLILDLERYPRWASEMRHVEVVDHDGAGRPRRARFDVDTPFARVAYTLYYDYDCDTVSFSLFEGEFLNHLEGSYTISDDRGTTTVDASLEIGVSVPLPSSLVEQAARTILDRALDGVRQQVEQAAS